LEPDGCSDENTSSQWKLQTNNFTFTKQARKSAKCLAEYNLKISKIVNTCVLSGRSSLLLLTVSAARCLSIFALYITSKFNVGMTDVGVLFAAFAASSFAGSAIGGALTDRFGRKGIIIFGLIASSFSTVAMGLIGSFQFFLALFVGILTMWQVLRIKP
jgi:predicted MFS family arabinose efflux permease